MNSVTSEALQEVRLGHFPGVISLHIRRLYRERRSQADLGSLRFLQPSHLINKLVIQYGRIHGRDEAPVANYLLDQFLDHWGSIEGGKTLVTEPYMHSSIWTFAKKFADAAGLSMEYIDDSTHNPKRPGVAPEEHRYCSRICFRIKEENH